MYWYSDNSKLIFPSDSNFKNNMLSRRKWTCYQLHLCLLIALFLKSFFLLYTCILFWRYFKNLPITFISQISIDVSKLLFWPKHADRNSVGLWLVNTICRTSLLIVMFCIGAGQPDIGSWWYTKSSWLGDWGSNVSS